MGTHRVLLLCDHPVLRQALGHYLDDCPHIVVVGHAGSLAAAGAQVVALHPELVVIGLSRVSSDVFAFIRRLKAPPNSPHVILLIPDDVPEYRTRAVAAGVDGYLAQADIVRQLLPLLEQLWQAR